MDRFIYLILLIIVVVISSCASSGNGVDNDGPGLTGHIWMLSELPALDMVFEAGDERVPNINLDEEGRMTGFAGCNRIFSGFDKRGDGEIRFSDVAGTKMYCDGAMELEDAFIAMLSKTVAYGFNGGMLHFKDAGNRVIAVFRIKE